MQRCRQCEATMTPTETECPSCGALAAPKTDKNSLKHRFRVAVKIFFLLSLVLTVVSIFTDYGPPVLTCAAVALILLLVKNSADEMLADNEN
jgi:hypothetical protein